MSSWCGQEQLYPLPFFPLHLIFIWYVISSLAGVAQYGECAVDLIGECGSDICVFTATSRPTLRITQSTTQCVQKALSLRAQSPGCEADHTPTSGVEVMNYMALYLHSPKQLHGMVLH
jgi:hypothetical protein